MDIHSEIKNILKIHSAVILKGIGGFISKYEPAKIENNKDFSPPQKWIGFKPELQYADNTLFEFLSTKYHFKTKEDLENDIEQFLESIISDLNNGKNVIFPGLGSLKKINDTIHFEIKIEKNLLDDAYGLDSFELLPAEEEQSQHIKSEPMPAKKKSDWGYWIAIFGVIIITLVAVGYIIYNNPENFNIAFFKKPKQDTPDIVLGKNEYIDSLHISSKLDENTLKENALSFTPEESQKQEEPEVPVPVIQNTYNFYIVAGSFANPVNAEKLKNNLIAKQLPADIIKVNENLYRVVIGKYNDKQSALNDYYRYKKQYKELNVWFSGS